MFNLNLLLDAAKDRQAELVHEVELTRNIRDLKAKRTSNSFVKKLRTFILHKA